MNRNKKISKIILLTVVFMAIAVFAAACATDGGYIAGQSGVGATGGLEAAGTTGDVVTVEDTDVPLEDDELAYDHDAIFGTDEPEEDGMMNDFPYYLSITGTVTSIEETELGLQVTIEDTDGNPAVLIITKDTVYPFDSEVSEGDTVTAWYATNMPMIMIWPPQYDVAVLAVNAPADSNIKVDRFDSWKDGDDGMMISQDGMLVFGVDEDTEIVLADGTDFTGGDLEGRRIVVIYGVSTRSIPEQTTATRLIVLFEDIMPLD